MQELDAKRERPPMVPRVSSYRSRGRQKTHTHGQGNSGAEAMQVTTFRTKRVARSIPHAESVIKVSKGRPNGNGEVGGGASLASSPQANKTRSVCASNSPSRSHSIYTRARATVTTRRSFQADSIFHGSSTRVSQATWRAQGSRQAESNTVEVQ